ncbi:nuclear transport factor 2 family protein [Christiangramia sabulilitoris]|uniref:Nuclear transport factor 2 family protein n=1 Tax=Christiangramia sabulilitoris TaxID=2583991 RepID=A0A550I094_9FLAO|nr:nuclear transport factor 2 family protein [Christiangramia sabulilitoris]TRO64238.1 nuclear transport factor 2 family protein [Christiangramia sabulilitoris]
MRSTRVYAVILTSFLFLVGCSENDENVNDSNLISKNASASMASSTSDKGSAVTSQTFPQAQQEVLETWEAIKESVIEGDIDKLISFHAYGPKFTEFKNGELRNGAEENEAYERAVFGSVTEVIKLDAQDIKIGVYNGNVAIMTFHADFQLMFGDNLAQVREQTSLLFVKTKGEWKIVHEHHSPLN